MLSASFIFIREYVYVYNTESVLTRFIAIIQRI